MNNNVNPIGAIKTEYKGYCFDSRTEARWAVFFDACGVNWEYRSKTFDLGDRGKYRPDFLLHGVAGRAGGDLYVEVKACANDERVKKITAFIESGAAIDGPKLSTATLLVGNIPNGNTIDGIFGNIQKASDESCTRELNYYNFSTIDGDNYAAYPCINKDGRFELFGYDSSKGLDYDATAEAYCKARKFKFDEEVPNKAEIVPNRKLALAELPDEIAVHYPELERIKEKFDPQEIWIETMVLGTRNYNAFRKLGGNRIIDKKRAEDLTESISYKDVFNPIKTNEKAEIIDGQGRYEARKGMKLPITFYARVGEGVEECRAMNQSGKQWDVSGYISSYAADGRPDFVLLENVQKETGMAYETIVKLCSKSDSKIYRKKIKYGSFSFTQADADKVRSIAKMSEEILEALTYQKRPKATFHNAVKIMSEKQGYSHKRMLSNCRKCRGTYVQMNALHDQLKEFSRIYNYGGKSKLYFEDYMKNKGKDVRDYDNMDRSWVDKRKEDVSTLR